MTRDDPTIIPSLTAPSSVTEQNISLDSVLAELQTWRQGKSNRNDKMPDFLWKKIFQLSEQFPPSSIRGLFGITVTQYKRQAARYQPSKDSGAPSTPRPAHVDLCAVTTTPSFYKPSELPAANTIVAEFKRADGQVMKIHTTTVNFKTLIQTFLELGYHAADLSAT